MGISVVGLEKVITGLIGFSPAIKDGGEKLVKSISYMAENNIKWRMPVYSGKAYTSIGNKSPSAPPVPPHHPNVKPSAAQKEQSEGKKYAIWKMKKSGLGDVEVTMGSSVEHSFTGKPYLQDMEDLGLNAYGEPIEPTHGHAPQRMHFFRDGVKAAMADFDNVVDATIFKKMKLSWKW